MAGAAGAAAVPGAGAAAPAARHTRSTDQAAAAAVAAAEVAVAAAGVAVAAAVVAAAVAVVAVVQHQGRAAPPPTRRAQSRALRPQQASARRPARRPAWPPARPGGCCVWGEEGGSKREKGMGWHPRVFLVQRAPTAGSSSPLPNAAQGSEGLSHTPASGARRKETKTAPFSLFSPVHPAQHSRQPRLKPPQRRRHLGRHPVVARGERQRHCGRGGGLAHGRAGGRRHFFRLFRGRWRRLARRRGRWSLAHGGQVGKEVVLAGGHGSFFVRSFLIAFLHSKLACARVFFFPLNHQSSTYRPLLVCLQRVARRGGQQPETLKNTPSHVSQLNRQRRHHLHPAPRFQRPRHSFHTPLARDGGRQGAAAGGGIMVRH